ncbi:hypothetical protein AO269_15235 [Pseudomonas putida]|nr:hypothetical protein AO269_15235 [Pseudomonas putida]
MKYSILASLLVLSLNASAAQQSLDLPSCNIKAQRELVGETGGKITDPRQAHISVRANILSADIGTTRKARKITQAEASSFANRKIRSNEVGLPLRMRDVQLTTQQINHSPQTIQGRFPSIRAQQ